MAIDIKYESGEAFLYIVVKGQSSLEEYKAAMDEITQSDQYPADINAMWDVRDQDFNSITSSTVESLIRISKKYPERGTARVAFIVKGDLAYGMLRMYEISSSIGGSGPSQHLRVFRSCSEGEKWLLDEEP